MKRFRLVALFAALVLVIGAGAVGLGGGGTAKASGPLIVDSDGHASYGNCATSNTTNVFTTIAAAVAAASPGDLIQICGPPSGPYAGATVNKANLFLRGLNNPVVTDAGTFGLDLQANGIRVEGITFTGNLDGIGSHTNSSGHLIQYDTFTNNTMGIFLNSANSGNSTIVRNNTFDNNNLVGASNGNGIYSDQGLHNAQITSNWFTHHDNAGVFIADNPGTDNVLIRSNTFADNDGNAVGFFNNVTLSTISSNTIKNAAVNPAGSSAIFLGGGGTHDDTVSSNTITNPHFSGIAIRDDGFGPAGGAFNITISSNTETGGGNNGIDVTATAPHATTTSSNQTRNNQNDGLFYGAGTTHNKIQSNVASGDLNFDCEDANGAGTTNTWTGNKGNTASPPFICSP